MNSEEWKIQIERLVSHMDRRQKTWSPYGYSSTVIFNDSGRPVGR
jgi:hypothetical protein